MNSSLFSTKNLFIAITAFSFFIVISASIAAAVNTNNRVTMGVQSMGKSLSGLTKAETRHFFEKAAKEKIEHRSILLEYKDRHWKLTAEEIHLQAKIDEATNEAYSLGRNKGTIQGALEQLRCAIFGKNIEFTADYDKEALQNKLNSIAHDVDASPKNAFVSIQPNGLIEKHPAVIGKKLNTETIAAALEPQLKTMHLPHEIALQPEETSPEILDDDISAINSVLASYSTSFYPGSRGSNIILAASKLNQQIIKSGMSFSFNTTVGERTSAAGYKNAPVIIDGEVEDGIGGGVCQVSSTLYNAILLAGLTSTVRTPHYYPSAYCPPGRDATVVDHLIDFQFKNQYPHTVCICTHTTSNTLTIYVLGCNTDLNGCSISLESEGPSLHPSIYRVYRKNNQVIQRDLLHTDSYSSH